MLRQLLFCLSMIVTIAAALHSADATEIEVIGKRGPNRWSSQGGDSPREAAIGRPDGRLVVKAKNGDTVLFRNESGTHGVVFERSKAERAAGTWQTVEGDLFDVTAVAYPTLNAAVAQTTKPKASGASIIKIRIDALASGASSGILFACDDHSLGADAERQPMLGVIVLDEAPISGSIVELNGGINGSVFFDFGRGNEVFPFGFQVFLREVTNDTKTEAVRTDPYGRYRLVAPRPGRYEVAWNDPNFGEGSSEKKVEITNRIRYLPDIAIRPPVGTLHGRIRMSDGSAPYYSDGKGLEEVAHVSILDANNRVIKGPLPANAAGQFAIAGIPRLSGIKIRSDFDAAVSETSSITVPLADASSPIILQIKDWSTRIKSLRDKQKANDKSPKDGSVPPASGFLEQKGRGSEDGAKKYYSLVDPKQRRGTLSDWWRVNGFDPKDGSGKDAVRAGFLNDNDLGFGRDMHLLLQKGGVADGNVAAFVTNYFEKIAGTNDPDFQNELNADLAFKADRAVSAATVCMEYAPIEDEATGKRVVKFFAYATGKPDAPLIFAADLDGGGDKFLPNLCLNCHGGDFSESFPKADLGSSFREFDLSTYKYPRFDTMGNSLPRNAKERLSPTPAEQKSFKAMNDIVVASNPTDSIKQIVKLWYQGGLDVQDPLARPPGWDASVASPQLPTFYRDVVAKSCRTCHVALGGLDDTELSWASYAQFQEYRSTIQRRTCSTGPVPLPMPHAKITY